MQLGLYERLINKILTIKLNQLDINKFHIQKTKIDKAEASNVLSQYLFSIIQMALNQIKGNDSIEKQIKLSNKKINLISGELNNKSFKEDLVETKANILSAVFSKLDSNISDFKKHIKEITPYTRLSLCELFTGNNAGISLESEI